MPALWAVAEDHPSGREDTPWSQHSLNRRLTRHIRETRRQHIDRQCQRGIWPRNLFTLSIGNRVTKNRVIKTIKGRRQQHPGFRMLPSGAPRAHTKSWRKPSSGTSCDCPARTRLGDNGTEESPKSSKATVPVTRSRGQTTNWQWHPLSGATLGHCTSGTLSPTDLRNIHNLNIRRYIPNLNNLSSIIRARLWQQVLIWQDLIWINRGMAVIRNAQPPPPPARTCSKQGVIGQVPN